MSLPDKPGLYIQTIQHDDWCWLLLGLGDCNCDPTLAEIVEITDENADAIAARMAADNRHTNKLRRALHN